MSHMRHAYSLRIILPSSLYFQGLFPLITSILQNAGEKLSHPILDSHTTWKTNHAATLQLIYFPDPDATIYFCYWLRQMDSHTLVPHRTSYAVIVTPVNNQAPL